MAADPAPLTADERAKALRWAAGLFGVWLVLTVMADLGETADLAVAIALVVMGSVLLQYGPDVLKELGVNTQFGTNQPSFKESASAAGSP